MWAVETGLRLLAKNAEYPPKFGGYEGTTVFCDTHRDSTKLHFNLNERRAERRLHFAPAPAQVRGEGRAGDDDAVHAVRRLKA
jgi:hypothetical protein